MMFNVLFLREHNRLCGILERAHPNWDQERIYQTSRAAVTVMVIKLVVEEFINHISPLQFQFRADPTPFYRSPWYRTNWMTVEFNLLYRWHSLVPNVIKVGERMLPLVDTMFNNKVLIDRGLAGAFKDASEQTAGAICLFNTDPQLVEMVEIRNIELGRYARLGSYNDYRKYVGFPAVTDFDQISGSDEVVRALRETYETVDNIEFFTGLFAEDTRPGTPLPPLIGRLVAIDAFSQAFTNPLLSEHVFKPETFAEGWDEIARTKTLSDLVKRNTPEHTGPPVLVSMDRPRTPKR